MWLPSVGTLFASLAIRAGIIGRSGKVESAAPSLHHGNRSGATRIGFENLAQPSPEHRKVTVGPLSLCGVNVFEECSRKSAFKKQAISTERLFDHEAELLEAGLWGSTEGLQNLLLSRLIRDLKFIIITIC